MDLLVFIGFGVLLFGGVWFFVRYLKRYQNTADRSYPESTDDGKLGNGGW